MQLYRARQELGGSIVLIGQATPRHAAHFRRRLGIDLPILADEQRESYRAVGAKLATMGELLGPRLLVKGLAASRDTGVHQGRTIGHPAQLGGAVVVAPNGGITYAHLSADASDNATPEELVAALAAAGMGSAAG